MLETWIRSLVLEVRSHMLWGNQTQAAQLLSLHTITKTQCSQINKQHAETQRHPANHAKKIKHRDITLPKKVHLVKSMVFPAVRYECESWTIILQLSAEELMLSNCSVGKDS